jgi:three-Cys-motif partner protein
MPTRETEQSFFKAKRSWSVMKDRILRGYMKPYLTKVRTTRLPIILMDCFAGTGRFEDGSPGSPIIMCEMAEKYGDGRCKCLFINKNKSHHRILTKNLEPFMTKKIAYTVAGESTAVSSQLISANQKFVLFGYFDPFGLKGCEFKAIANVLNRTNNRSTEVLINLNVSGLHRLAATKANAKGDVSEEIKRGHKILDDTLGGNYWRQYLFDDSLSAEEKEASVVETYKSQLKKLLPFVGSCPVSETPDGPVKYHLVFCSGHIDGLALMNDFMCTVYNDHMHSISMEKLPLLKSGAIPNWKSDRKGARDELKNIVLAAIQKFPNSRRLELWHHIVQDHFMKFLESDYKASTKALFDAGTIDSPTPRPTRKLNDSCILRLTQV